MGEICVDDASDKITRYPKKWPSVAVIVAATSAMGMSYNTHLPWPKLKRENGYFETTTKRSPVPGTMNAVIMGYKTWDDEPTKLYSDRINVVVTRDPRKVLDRLRNDTRRGYLHVATNLEEAVQLLEKLYGNTRHGTDELDVTEKIPRLGRIFVIGGAVLCSEAFKFPWVNRLLLTRVTGDFKVDTFFPLIIDGEGNEQWQRKSDRAFQEWAGPDTPTGPQYENGILWQAAMFERKM